MDKQIKAVGEWLKSAGMVISEKRRYIQVGLTLCGGLGLSIGACLVVYGWEYKLMKAELQDRLDKIATAIQRDVSGNVEVLQAIGALYSASDEIKQEEFQPFVKSALFRHPSLQAIAWLPIASGAETPASLEGNFNFEIAAKTEQGTALKINSPLKYLPPYDVVSFRGNELVFGFNLLGNPTYVAAIKRAAEQEEIVVTAPIASGETENKLYVLVFQPIYSQSFKFPEELPNFLSNKGKKMNGIVIGIFRINEIFKAALSEEKLEGMNFYLQDAMASEKERFLAFYEAKGKQLVTDSSRDNNLQGSQTVSCPDGSACTRILNIENRRWLLQLLLAPEFVTVQKHWRSLGTLILGMLITSLAIAYLLILLRYTEQIEKVVSDRTAKSKQLEETLQELQKTQVQLVQNEKMTSLGQLVAGVAHEINNPVNFIYGNLHHASEYTKDLLGLIELYQKHDPNPHSEIREYIKNTEFDFLFKDMPKLISSMKMGTDRILGIVRSLRTFSRLDESEMKPVNIHEGIDSTLLILQSRLKAKPDRPEIEIVKKYGNLPLVECYAGQLNQVFMNIISNAIDALESDILSRGNYKNKQPRITIATESSYLDSIVVRIADNGSGMTDRVQKQLFDPFFTTKPVGKGTGLGLSISYQIVVDKHGGSLRCCSALGQGTEFRIEIPARQQNSL